MKFTHFKVKEKNHLCFLLIVVGLQFFFFLHFNLQFIKIDIDVWCEEWTQCLIFLFGPPVILTTSF